MAFRFVPALVALFFAVPAFAELWTGVPHIVDGDTITQSKATAYA